MDQVENSVLSRRTALKRAGTVAALTVWTAPVVQTLARPAFAAGSMPSFGNGATPRSDVDTYANFSIYDTNQGSPVDGTITSIEYYAGSTTTDVSGRSFRFLLVDPGGVVKYKSALITVPTNGHYTFVPPSPVPVQQGWFVGFYVAGQGVVPWDSTGSSAVYTPENAGEPTVGQTLVSEGATPRHYSFQAHTAT